MKNHFLSAVTEIRVLAAEAWGRSYNQSKKENGRFWVKLLSVSSVNNSCLRGVFKYEWNYNIVSGWFCVQECFKFHVGNIFWSNSFFLFHLSPYLFFFSFIFEFLPFQTLTHWTVILSSFILFVLITFLYISFLQTNHGKCPNRSLNSVSISTLQSPAHSAAWHPVGHTHIMHTLLWNYVNTKSLA